ncbi:MAG TPA: major capsid protein [Terriglobia bacterium]|nr:major capsid protein [Terriglobia bacterium]
MADISLQYLDQPLNNVSVGYKNDDYYAERLFPPVPVQKQSGRYWVFGRERFRPYETIRHAGAEAREIAPWSLSNNTYFCDDHSLKDKISDEEVANASGTDLDITTTENLTDALLLDLEIRVATLVFGGAVPSMTLSGTSQWSDYINSDPVSAVEAQKTTIKKAVGKTPNTLAVSYPVFATLRQHPRIIDRFKYTQVGVLDEDCLKTAFGVDNFWVMGAEFDTATEGQAPALDFVWGKTALLAYVVPEPRRREVTLGYTFRWLFGAPELGGTLTKRYRVEAKSADVVEVHRYDDIEAVAPQAGLVFLCATN